MILKKFHNKFPFVHTSHLNPELFKIKIFHFNPVKLIHRYLISLRYRSFLKLLGNIVVSEDRLEFFHSLTNKQIYKLDYLFIDFKTWNERRIKKEEAKTKLGINNNDIIFFSSSRLVPEKQIDKLLFALSHLKNEKFICFVSGTGTDDYINYLKKLVNKYKLNDRVKFVGYLTNELIYYYCAADFFITTSISEGGPVSGLIALALEIPVVSTNTGMLYYLLKKYDAGLILDRKDYLSWSVYLENLIKKKEINIIDVNKLINDYNIEKGINQLVPFYNNTLDKFFLKKN